MDRSQQRLREIHSTSIGNRAHMLEPEPSFGSRRGKHNVLRLGWQAISSKERDQVPRRAGAASGIAQFSDCGRRMGERPSPYNCGHRNAGSSAMNTSTLGCERSPASTSTSSAVTIFDGSTVPAGPHPDTGSLYDGDAGYTELYRCRHGDVALPPSSTIAASPPAREEDVSVDQGSVAFGHADKTVGDDVVSQALKPPIDAEEAQTPARHEADHSGAEANSLVPQSAASTKLESKPRIKRRDRRKGANVNVATQRAVAPRMIKACHPRLSVTCFSMKWQVSTKKSKC
ncbi:hypothetical protein EMEDMD4_1280062 [Sinorhizobium medicae]|uniref:Uncharacterized protein n=1 Tax=Sinorhizobium medicae TaxID=110321 RepID=A0A508WQS9_9HYPH|nr:hypothetical protein EMEDMD4_1280062 [Sinorhizobium medicae]